MTDTEFVKRFGKQYLSVLQDAEKLHYKLNEEQFIKLFNLVEFFKDYVKSEKSGKIDSIDLDPKEIHGGLTATFVLFDISGNQIKEFCEVLKDTSAITLDATTDGKVCISITVPNVFSEI